MELKDDAQFVRSLLQRYAEAGWMMKSERDEARKALHCLSCIELALGMTANADTPRDGLARPSQGLGQTTA